MEFIGQLDKVNYESIQEIPQEKGLIYIHLNDRSLVHKIEEIRLLLSEQRINGYKIKPITCVTVYRAPYGSTQRCIDLLGSIANGIKKDCKGEVVFHGDFNIDYKNKNCKWSQEMKGWELANGLKQIITKPTRIDKSSASIIDLCFTNIQHSHKSGVLDLNIFDHFPTYLIKKKGREIKIACSFQGRNYKELNSGSVENVLLSFNDQQEDINQCPNETWLKMQSAFVSAADVICPIKTFYIRHDKPAYFTEDLNIAISEREELYRKARLKKSEADWNAARRKKLEVRKLLLVTKRNYIKENLTRHSGNPVKYWKTMGKLLKQSKDPPITNIINEDNQKINGVEAANAINDYFCCIVQKLASKI